MSLVHYRDRAHLFAIKIFENKGLREREEEEGAEEVGMWGFAIAVLRTSLDQSGQAHISSQNTY